MWKINFYLLPSMDYSKISFQDALDLGDTVEYASIADAVWIPDEFYEEQDICQVNAVDFLYGNNRNDISDYLLEIISKQKACSDTYKRIEELKEQGYIIFSSDSIIKKDNKNSSQYIKHPEDVIQVKRYFISKVDNYEEYIVRIKAAFPDLFFHEDALKNIKKLGKFSSINAELTRHLKVLNDFAGALYNENSGNEDEIFKMLKSKYGIVCSGKGSNETTSYKLNCRGYQITCNPHTKFFQGNNDQRIYFCWGRDEIENHKIIIAKIGNHWDSK